MFDVDDGTTRVAFAGSWSDHTAGLRQKFARLTEAGITRLHHVGVIVLGYGPADRRFLERVNAWAVNAGITITLTGGAGDDWDRLTATFAETEGCEPIVLRSNIAALPAGFRWTHRNRSFLSAGLAPSVNLWQSADEHQFWEETLPTDAEFEGIMSGDRAEVLIATDSPIPGTPIVNTIRNTLGRWAADSLLYAEFGARGINTIVDAVDPSLIIHAGFGVHDETIQPDGRRIVSLTNSRQLDSVLILDLVTLATSRLGAFDA
jgi:hypothetical protein